MSKYKRMYISSLGIRSRIEKIKRSYKEFEKLKGRGFEKKRFTTTKSGKREVWEKKYEVFMRRLEAKYSGRIRQEIRYGLSQMSSKELVEKMWQSIKEEWIKYGKGKNKEKRVVKEKGATSESVRKHFENFEGEGSRKNQVKYKIRVGLVMKRLEEDKGRWEGVLRKVE